MKTTWSESVEIIRNGAGIHSNIVDQVPKLARGRVWCVTCGKTHKVDPAQCMRSGWPKCCGATMTIDSPEERAALPRVRAKGDKRDKR